MGSIHTFCVECVDVSRERHASGTWPASSESTQTPQFYRHRVENHRLRVREVRGGPSLSQMGSTVAAASLCMYTLAQLCWRITWYAPVIMWRLLEKAGWAVLRGHVFAGDVRERYAPASAIDVLRKGFSWSVFSWDSHVELLPRHVTVNAEVDMVWKQKSECISFRKH